MDNMRKELENLKSRFKELDDRKKVFFRDFGDFLRNDAQAEAVSAVEILADGLSRMKAVEEEKKSLEDKIDEIKTLLDEKKRLEDERKLTRESIRDLEKANQSLYENMGRAGYQAFREGLLNDGSYGSVFLTLEEEKEKINTFEVELKKGSLGEKNFFKKIMNRSREVYLKSNQNLKIRNLVKIYQKAGEALGEMEVPWKENDSLKHAFLPFYKNREKQQELSGKDNVLAGNEHDLIDKMESLGIQRNSGKRRQDLADDIVFQDEKLNQEKVYLGQSWWSMDKKNRKEFKLPGDLKKRKADLDGDEDELSRQQDILERKILRKELFERLKVQEKESLRLENRLSQLSEDISRKNGEIEDTKRELEETQKELTDLGAEES